MGETIYREGESGEPKFPSTFTVEKKAVLQVTDIKTNRNKYYAIELHNAKSKFRVYTHYGRTDDLDSNPNAGIRESRYFDAHEDAEEAYNSIYAQKTSVRKGYKELSLASSKIGSKKTYGQSSGEIDAKTIKKLADKSPTVAKAVVTISSEVQDIVSYLYKEATNALVSTVNASITANGIETPLGVLTIGQIDKGQLILDQLANKMGSKKDTLSELSGEFYTLIPHKFGRSRAAAQAAVIDSTAKLAEKQDTLQLMRDMLNVNGSNNALLNPEIQKKYEALNCKIEYATNSQFDKVQKIVGKGTKIKNVWAISRPDEVKVFTEHIDNKNMLFHGSNAKNWLGILSRGLLMPKAVVKLGVHRTDAGWLGNGIYFGDVPETSLNYAGSGSRGTSFMAVANVALGKIKKYSKITYGICSAPAGYDSCHGVAGTEFDDDEFVIYDQRQQKIEFLVECK